MKNPADTVIRLGALRIGAVTKRVVPVVNNSLCPLTFSVLCTPSTTSLHDSRVLRILPQDSVTLPAKGGTMKVEVIFAPKSRIAPFAEEVGLISLKRVL